MILQKKCNRYLALYGLILIFSFLFPVNFTSANEQSLTISDIEKGLLIGEDAFTDLRFEYVEQWRMPFVEDGSSNVIHRVEGTYARKIPGMLRYQETKFSRFNANGDVNLFMDGWASYDGNATYTLDRVVRTGKPKHGFIRPGYDPNQFKITGGFDPVSNIWNLGKKSLADFIKGNNETFQIGQEKEIIDGISTIKLEGSFGDGKLATKLWISPERNYLPIKKQIYNSNDGKLRAETVLSNLIQLPNGLWFPKSIRFGSPDPNWAIYQENSNISIDPIPKDFFTPDFPTDTDVYDEILGIKYEK